MGVGGQRHATAALPPGKTRYPLYMRLSGPHGRSGRMRKFWPSQGFDPRTVQPVEIRYTDRAIPAHSNVSPNVSQMLAVQTLLHINNEACLNNMRGRS
jgi:hypothetical protein